MAAGASKRGALEHVGQPRWQATRQKQAEQDRKRLLAQGVRV